MKRKKENKKRRIPDKAYGIMRQNNLQISLSFVLMGQPLLGKRPALKCGLYMTDTALEKNNFICRCFSVGDSFLVKDGGFGLLFLSALGLYLV